MDIGALLQDVSFQQLLDLLLTKIVIPVVLGMYALLFIGAAIGRILLSLPPRYSTPQERENAEAFRRWLLDPSVPSGTWISPEERLEHLKLAQQEPSQT